MRVKLRIEFATCVMPIRRDNPVASCAILICAVQTHARTRIAFGFCQRLSDSLIMGGYQPPIAANHCLHGNRFWR